MNDVYCVYIVKRKLTKTALLARYIVVFSGLTVTFLGTLILAGMGFAGGFLFLYLGRVVFRNTSTEYEYIFVSGDLDIDIIYGKFKRKKARRFNMHKMEIMAPLGSDKLDYYDKNRKLKVMDYSSGYKDRNKYVIIMPMSEGIVGKVIFEPNEKILEAIKLIEPGKVHLN